MCSIQAVLWQFNPTDLSEEEGLAMPLKRLKKRCSQNATGTINDLC